jgi:hypothetical protein
MAVGILVGMHRTLRKDSKKLVRHGTGRQVRKDYHRAIRAIDAPDEACKVACCPKCRGWFPSVEDRNAHRELARKLGSCALAENPEPASEQTVDVDEIAADAVEQKQEEFAHDVVYGLPAGEAR